MGVTVVSVVDKLNYDVCIILWYMESETTTFYCYGVQRGMNDRGISVFGHVTNRGKIT